MQLPAVPFLPSLLEAFATAHPWVQIELSEGTQDDLMSGTLSGDIDVSMRCEEPAHPGLAMVQVKETRVAPNVRWQTHDIELVRGLGGHPRRGDDRQRPHSSRVRTRCAGRGPSGAGRRQSARDSRTVVSDQVPSGLDGSAADRPGRGRSRRTIPSREGPRTGESGSGIAAGLCGTKRLKQSIAGRAVRESLAAPIAPMPVRAGRRRCRLDRWSG
ncbi:LysR substrate-binding domain-containing protein [Amycolatopsis jejuensis]|uniref:LysR substrate-binding domain-containing protein n=1 Tax=Amycolatopsis jejuensis TaxID=330084 RepID=UPI00138E11E9